MSLYHRLKMATLVALTALASLDLLSQNSKTPDVNTPEALYGQLFYDVQNSRHLFKDSKTFVDCRPLAPPEKIKYLYSKLPSKDTHSLKSFVNTYFKEPQAPYLYKTDSLSIGEHILKLWEVLKRPADTLKPGTLIPLPKSYIVPGGRFREIYYWDSYFTMLGLKKDGQTQMVENMVTNFSHLIATFGFIPNGNRTYYLSRSQPPFYALMIDLLATIKGEAIYSEHVAYLEKEYTFWMDGASQLNKTKRSHRRVVRMPGGELLNRYWDDQDSPRPESYIEDVETAQLAVSKNKSLKKESIYRHIRAAAESGWDFSSRWFSNASDLHTIHTTDIVPVDLNCLMYHLETVLAQAYRLKGDTNKASYYKSNALSRSKAIMKYFWSPDKAFFMDYDFVKGGNTGVYSLAGMYPLYFKIADTDRAEKVQQKIQASFLKAGGLACTLTPTSQQWDAPNGWAPLHWLAVQGLYNYGYTALGDTIKNRWTALVKNVYDTTFKIMEKYNVEDLKEKGGGGEYPTQDGFGWTNGVMKAFIEE